MDSQKNPMELHGQIRFLGPDGTSAKLSVQLIVAQGVLPSELKERIETWPDRTPLTILNLEMIPGYATALDPVYTGTVIAIGEHLPLQRVPEPPMIESVPYHDGHQ
jgi:hypothetical protein